MFIEDALNRIYGRHSLVRRAWAMRQRRRSPRYTTRWNEILTV